MSAFIQWPAGKTTQVMINTLVHIQQEKGGRLKMTKDDFWLASSSDKKTKTITNNTVPAEAKLNCCGEKNYSGKRLRYSTIL